MHLIRSTAVNVKSTREPKIAGATHRSILSFLLSAGLGGSSWFRIRRTIPPIAQRKGSVGRLGGTLDTNFAADHLSALENSDATSGPPFVPIKFFMTGTNFPIMAGDIPSDWKDPASVAIPLALPGSIASSPPAVAVLLDGAAASSLSIPGTTLAIVLNW